MSVKDERFTEAVTVDQGNVLPSSFMSDTGTVELDLCGGEKDKTPPTEQQEVDDPLITPRNPQRLHPQTVVNEARREPHWPISVKY
jgi:hypothetical protein